MTAGSTKEKLVCQQVLCYIQCACASDCVNWSHLTYQCSLSLVSHSIPYFDSKIVATERTAEYLWTMLPTNMNVGSLIPRHSTQIVITFTIACFHVVTYAQGLEESGDTWCFQINWAQITCRIFLTCTYRVYSVPIPYKL